MAGPDQEILKRLMGMFLRIMITDEANIDRNKDGENEGLDKSDQHL